MRREEEVEEKEEKTEFGNLQLFYGNFMSHAMLSHKDNDILNIDDFCHSKIYAWFCFIVLFIMNFIWRVYIYRRVILEQRGQCACVRTLYRFFVSSRFIRILYDDEIEHTMIPHYITHRVRSINDQHLRWSKEKTTTKFMRTLSHQ